VDFWLKELKKRFITSEVKVSEDGESLAVVAQAIEDVKMNVRKQKGLQ
jgi:hypothetical protein